MFSWNPGAGFASPPPPLAQGSVHPFPTDDFHVALRSIAEALERQDIGKDVKENWLQKSQDQYRKGSYSRAAVFAMVGSIVRDEKEPVPERILLLTKSLMKLGLYSHALELIEPIVADTNPSPFRNQLLLLVGESHYRQENYLKAISIFKQLGKNEETKIHEPKVAFLTGMSHFKNGDFLNAIKKMERVSKNSKYYPFALYTTALAHYHLNRVTKFEETLKNLSHFLQNSNSNITRLNDWVHLVLGEFLLNKDPNEAEKIFERFSIESEFFKRVLFNLAWTHFKREEYVKAIVLFRKLTDEFPGTYESQVALLMIGHCYSRLSAYEKAVSHFRNLLDEYTRDIQQIEQRMHHLNRRDKHYFLRTVEHSKPPEEFGRLKSTFSAGIDPYTISKAIQDLRKLGEDVGGRTEFPETKPIERVEAFVAETLYQRQMEKLKKQKLNVEELLVRSSLGIARNLSPKDLQLKD